MSNTKTSKNTDTKLHPQKVAEALYNDLPVEHRGWLIRIDANADTVQVFPPEGDSHHQAFEADLCHLDKAVSDFCKLAEMPIPGVNTHPKDQVNVGKPSKVLGPDSSVGEGWKNPKINERPTGLDQKGTSAPSTRLGPDTSSQNVPHFNPAINKRPKDPVGRGGLPDTDLGPDSSSAPTNWRDRLVKIQEDGRTGKKAFHDVKPPKRGPGQLGYGKAQMGEEVGPEGDGIQARRRAESDPFNVTPVEEPGKHLNKGEDPSDPKEVIHTEQGPEKNSEKKGLRRSAWIEDTFGVPKVDASEVYRRMSAKRPSAELLKDIFDPQKWSAANLMDPKRAQELQLEPIPDEDEAQLEFLPDEDENESGYYSDTMMDAEDLVLFIENDGDLYRSQTQSIINNLMRKLRAGTFDETRSVDLWYYLAEEGAKRFAQQNKDSLPPLPWHKLFPVSVRVEAAQQLADYYNPMITKGEFGDIWPRRGQVVDTEACSGGSVKAVAPPGWEDTVKDMKKHPEIDNPWALAWSEKNKGAKPGGSDKKESRRVAGPRIKENWGGDGAYSRELSTESSEELHALTLALGGQEVDWSRFAPAMPAGGESESESDEGAQPEGPKAQQGTPAPAAPVVASNKDAGSYSFMKPEVVQGTWLIVDTDLGGEVIPSDVVDMKEARELQSMMAADPGVPVDLKDFDLGKYVQGSQLYELDIKEGFGARLSAPGYLDSTDWTFFDNEADAMEYLENAYGSDDESDDEQMLASRKAGYIDSNEPKVDGGSSGDFLFQDANPAVGTGQQMGAGDPNKTSDQHSEGSDPDEGFDENSPEYLAENVINGNWSVVIQAVAGNPNLALEIYEILPEDLRESFRGVLKRSANKQAVDTKSKSYWGGYFGDYGKELTEEKKLKTPPKETKGKNDAKEARKQAFLNARRAQQAPVIQQPAPPAQSPSNPPASGAAPATPGAPAAPKPAPAAPAGGTPPTPKNVPGSSPMPSGTGDQGLQTLGWTADDISLMDESDKKKILQIQLSKPGSNSKPKTPGGDKAPGGAPSTPSIPPSPIVPTPGPVPAGPTPATPTTPKPGASVASRLAGLMVKKLERRKALRAQVAPGQPSGGAGATPSVGMAPAQQPAAPAGGTTPPGKSAPGAAATPKEPSMTPEGGDGSSEQKAFDILQEVQQSNVEASSPEQVLSAKVSELARRLLTEVGMTTNDAKTLFGIKADGGLDKLFQ